jgi:hypothetical protein
MGAMTMPKVAGCGAIALAMILVGACASNGGKGGTGGAGAGGSGTGGSGTGGVTGVGGGTGGAGGMGTGGEGAHGGSGAGGQDAGSPDAPDGSPDAISCCPPDPDPSLGGTATIIGQARLGGARIGFNMCGPGYDFFCTTNWRLEPDQYGCPTWHSDFDHSGNCITGFDATINHVDAGDGGH